ESGAVKFLHKWDRYAQVIKQEGQPLFLRSQLQKCVFLVYRKTHLVGKGKTVYSGSRDLWRRNIKMNIELCYHCNKLFSLAILPIVNVFQKFHVSIGIYPVVVGLIESFDPENPEALADDVFRAGGVILHDRGEFHFSAVFHSVINIGRDPEGESCCFTVIN